MNCPNCGSPNQPGRKFCGECGDRLAVVCPSCGTANAPSVRFCGECGTQLVAGTATSAAQAAGTVGSAPGGPTTAAAATAAGVEAAGGSQRVAERRLVTVLFADLVGFTTLSEGRDHEEVRELLSRYFDAARVVIERYGGTVEKFIGDAVMAVWGAPTAHEDDAERGVRAALDVVEAVRALGPGLEARVGILTGEAAVTLGATGQGMVAGDLVNTASRLQSAAPAGLVLVGESTQRATSGAIAYESAGEQLLKGKATQVPAFRALRVIGGRGGRGRADKLEAPFVGRDSELRLLKDIYHATAREKRVRLVSITGEAGVGKSRLAWELRKYADGIVDAVWWHQGRSPSYGEGVTFWALGEMVRSRAFLVETDDEATTRAKLSESVGRFFGPGEERDRVERALQVLLGVGEGPAGGAGELFGAWRLYFERMAAQGLVVLVFEDMHWADQGLLDFVGHVLEWSRSVPILIITLARPELLERRPDWGAGRRNFLALDLGPLAQPAMRELLTGLVPELPEAAVRSIISRAEGMPLYAVETIRMLVSDGRLREREAGGYEPTGDLGELAIPETLRALIAARLDSLDPAERALTQDAAVLGQSFWPAALAAVSGLKPAELDARLRVLVRSDLLREEIDTRSPEVGQYTFVQALIREVAYSTLALKDRRSRHLAAARFFESLGDEELASALAAHYVAAYRASPAGPEADALASQARVSLRAAADRAIGLGAPIQAMAFLEQAAEVAADDADRATMLEQAADAASTAARSELALPLLDRAEAIRDRLGDPIASARNAVVRVRALHYGRQRESALKMANAALERFRDLGPEELSILELTLLAARSAVSTGHYDLALDAAERVVVIAERLGLAQDVAEALVTKGIAYFFLGRLWEARAVLEGARVVAQNFSLPDVELRAIHNLGLGLALDDPASAVDLERIGIALARRLGDRSMETILIGNAGEDAIHTGDWGWALDELEGALQLDIDAASRRYLVINRAAILAYQGRLSPSDREEIVALAVGEDRGIEATKHFVLAAQASAAGDWGLAHGEWITMADLSELNAPYCLPQAALLATIAGDPDAARAAIARLRGIGTRGRWVDAIVAAVNAGIAAIEGDRGTALAGYRQAMAAMRDLRLPWDEAWVTLAAVARLGAGSTEVQGWIDRANEILEQLGAQPVARKLAELAERPALPAPTGKRAAVGPFASADPASAVGAKSSGSGS